MKKLLICASLLALWGTNGEADTKFVNNTNFATTFSILVNGHKVWTSPVVNPSGGETSTDITQLHIAANASMLGFQAKRPHGAPGGIPCYPIPDLHNETIADINNKTIKLMSDPRDVAGRNFVCKMEESMGKPKK